MVTRILGPVIPATDSQKQLLGAIAADESNPADKAPHVAAARPSSRQMAAKAKGSRGFRSLRPRNAYPKRIRFRFLPLVSHFEGTMTAVVELTIPQAAQLSQEVLRSNGLGEAHALAIASLVCRAQVDDCQSHGLYRLLDCVRTLRAGDVSPDALPAISQPSDVVVRVDANGAFAPLSFNTGLPIFAEKTRRHGIAVMALNNCCHFSALWAEVEDLTTQGLAAIVMLPSHSYVAPAGGTRPLFGTNPFAFGWPRPGKNPYVFDFATSVVARGEIELHRLRISANSRVHRRLRRDEPAGR